MNEQRVGSILYPLLFSMSIRREKKVAKKPFFDLAKAKEKLTETGKEKFEEYRKYGNEDFESWLYEIGSEYNRYVYSISFSRNYEKANSC